MKLAVLNAGKVFPKSDEILYSVSTDIERYLDPAVIAANLIGKKLIGKDNIDYLCSHTGGRKSEKISQILSWISMCGNKPEILLRFYAALEETSDRAPSHIQLARIIRLKGLCGYILYTCTFMYICVASLSQIGGLTT